MSDKAALQLQIVQAGLTADELAQRSRMVFDVLRNGLPEVEVSHATGSAAPGGKGDPFTIAAIILAVFTSGAATAFFDCCKAIFARDKKLKLVLTLPDGTLIDIDGQNVGDAKIEDLFRKSFKVGASLRKSDRKGGA